MIARATTGTNNQTLLHFLEQVYFLKPEIAGGSPATKKFYLGQVRKADRYWQTLKPGQELMLADMSPELITGSMAWCLQLGNSKPTANKIRRSLVAIWEHAKERGYLPDRPPKIGSFKEPKRDPEAWWDWEFEKMLQSACRLTGQLQTKSGGKIPRGEFAEALLRVVYNSGSRISAAMSIRRDWIDLRSKRLVIVADVQKDAEDQTVALLPSTVAALERLMEYDWETISDLWPYDCNVDAWPALDYLLRKIIVVAGLRGSTELREAVERGYFPRTEFDRDLKAEVTKAVDTKRLWHCIRRTFATMITAKSSIETAREMLGHSSIEVTKRYVDRSKLGEKSQADLLSDPAPFSLRVFHDDAG